jgi:hypothetical protein
MDQAYLTTDLIELKEHATFQQQSEMDNTIYEYIERLRNDEVAESVIEVLLFLGRSSLRVLGVSFAKYDTIGKAVGKSKSTVIRAVRTLKEYGMIDVIPTLKKWQGYGASRKKSVNVILVTPQNETTVTPDEATSDKGQTDESESESLEYKHQDPYILDTAIKNCIPTPIFEALSPFYEASDIRRLTGIVFRAKAAVHRDIRLEHHAEPFKTVVLDCIRRLKSEQLRSLDGYLYVSLRKLFRRLQIESAWAAI